MAGTKDPTTGKWKRNRPRVPGSWRDQEKGKCFTTGKGAVVCEGSKGMKYKKHAEKVGRQGDKELLDLYGDWSVRQLNKKLDEMKGVSSAGGGSKVSKIKKIHKHGGRLRKDKTRAQLEKEADTMRANWGVTTTASGRYIRRPISRIDEHFKNIGRIPLRYGS